MSQIIFTYHAQIRLGQRKIDPHEAIKIAQKGHILQIRFDGTIIRTGTCSNGRTLGVVSKKEGNKLIIKTIYFL